MKKHYFAIVGIIVFCIMISGCGRGSEDELTQLQEMTDATANGVQEEAVALGIKEKNVEDMEQSTLSKTTIGQYIQYTGGDIEDYHQSGTQLILVFYHPDNQSCVVLDADIRKKQKLITPDNVLLHIDLETYPTLEQHYKLKTANTVIFLDETMKEKFRLSRGIIYLKDISKYFKE